jgi:uracil-DNA glycosylase
MPKRTDPPPNDLLFGDLSVTESREHAEQVNAPADDSLERILADLRDTHFCGVCRPGMPIVFGVGPAPAELMLVGEGPGVDDIESESPFQGQAGLLLTKMLAAIGRARSECYICNVIKCVPPGERNFSPEEVADCRPILLRQILAVRPKVVVAFGALAAQTLLGSKKTISELRGREYTLRLNGHEMALVASFNPAYLLRVAEKKREAWEDLKLVRELLSEK